MKSSKQASLLKVPSYQEVAGQESLMEFRPSSGPEAAPGRKEPSKYVHGGNNDPPGKHKDRKLFRGEDLEAISFDAHLCKDMNWIKKHMMWKENRQTGAGLSNLGNTCFLNATLQCIAYTPPFAQYLMEQRHLEHWRLQDTDMFTILSKVIKGMHHRPNGVFKPTPIIQRLPLLNRIFHVGRQEDAHEFLRCLLYALHKDELKNAGLKESKAGRRAETNAIHTIYGGYLRNQVHCPSCGHNSNTFDPFLDLSLDVSNGVRTLGQALLRYVSKETLDADNKYMCEHCHKKVCAEKRMSIRVPPNCLAIHFKRFSFVRHGLLHGEQFSGMSRKKLWKMMCRKGGGSSDKLEHFIEYPTKLDLTPALSDIAQAEQAPSIYYLHGILVHLGHSVNSGHYYSYIKSPAGQWFCMDDSSVRMVSRSEALRQKAYMLFYSRKEFMAPLLRSSKSKTYGVNQEEGTINPIPSHSREESSINGSALDPEDVGQSVDNYANEKTREKDGCQAKLNENRLDPKIAFRNGIKNADNSTILSIDAEKLSKNQRKKVRKELKDRIQRNLVSEAEANGLLTSAGLEPIWMAECGHDIEDHIPSANVATPLENPGFEVDDACNPVEDVSLIASKFNRDTKGKFLTENIEKLASVKWEPPNGCRRRSDGIVSYLINGDDGAADDVNQEYSPSVKTGGKPILEEDTDSERDCVNNHDEPESNASISDSKSEMNQGPEKVEVTGERRKYVKLLSTTFSRNGSFSSIVGQQNTKILFGGLDSDSMYGTTNVGCWSGVEEPHADFRNTQLKQVSLGDRRNDREEWNAILDEGKKPKKKRKRSEVESMCTDNPFQEKSEEKISETNRAKGDSFFAKPSFMKKTKLVLHKTRDGVNRFIKKRCR